MKKIILDTNFLLIPGQNKVDIFAEIDRICLFKYQIVVLDRTIDELNTLKLDKGKTGQYAKLALSLIKNKKPKILKTKPGHVDDIIVELADKDTIVATQDQNLKKRLKATSLIVLRAKKYLTLIGA